MSKVKEWAKARVKLKKIYEEKNMTVCEVQLSGCWNDNGLSFHHKRKRIEYYSCPEKLGEFNETLLTCCVCHKVLEEDKELSDKYFKELRT